MPVRFDPSFPKLLLIAVCLWVSNGTGFSRGWSVTEFQYQGGRTLGRHLASPEGFRNTLTLQHASGGKFGEQFFFVDTHCCSGAGAIRDIYLEWYPYVSLGQVTGRDLSWGPIRGIGPLGGLNWGAGSRVLKVTPGFRFQLDLPGFSFANLDYLYLVDRSRGLAAGGAPKESNSQMIDFNWQLPFKIGGQSFSFEGHGEWQSSRDTEFGSRAPYWILVQPQLRLDVGQGLFKHPDRLFAGIEFQAWVNQFGIEDADEVLLQLLVVFRF